MQQKYLKYILLLGAALVWGVIILRILSSLSDTPNTQHAFSQKPVFEPNDSSDYKPYDLILEYDDPFGAEEDKISQADPAADLKKEGNRFQNSNSPGDPKPDISFIRYKGMIANTVTNKRAAIISINGRDVLARAGGKINNIRINKIQKDKILITYLGEKYWLKSQ